MPDKPQPRYAQMPDGTYIEWPENVSAKDFKAKLAGKFGNPMPVYGSEPPAVKPSYWEALTNPVGAHGREQGPLGGALQIGGQAIKTMAQPVLHPIDTLKGISKIASDIGNPQALGEDIATPLVQNYAQDKAQGGHALALENLAGNVLGSVEGGRALGTVPAKIGTALRTGAGTLNDALIGTPSKALRFGAEPGLQMAKEGIVGSSPASLSSSIQERIPQAAAEHRAIVASAPANVRINTGPLVTQPFKDVVAGATNPATGAGGAPAIRAAIRTGRELTNVIDPDTGQVTQSMRNPMITPLDATQLKSNLYGRINYDNPSKMALANTGLKGAAHNLKEAVETAVPESIPAGQRLHNLMSAKDILEPAARNQTLPTSKAGLIDRAVLGTGTRAASGIHTAGSALPVLGAPIGVGVPLGAEDADRTQRLIQYLRGNQ